MPTKNYKDKEQIFLELAKTRQEMEKARLRKNHFAFKDLKTHYDKLIKELGRIWRKVVETANTNIATV